MTTQTLDTQHAGFDGGHADDTAYAHWLAANRAEFDANSLPTTPREAFDDRSIWPLDDLNKPARRLTGNQIVGAFGIVASVLTYQHFRNGWPLVLAILAGLFTIGIYVFFEACESAPVVDGFEIMDKEEAE